MSKHCLSAALLLTISLLLVISGIGRAQPNVPGKRIIYVNVIADSQEVGYEAVNALDGNPQTIWHSEFRKQNPHVPHELVIDLGSEYEIVGFDYLPRAGGGNGTVKRFALYVSNDDRDYGTAAVRGQLSRVQSTNSVRLPEKKTGRFVKFVALSEARNRPWTSVAELDIVSPGAVFRTAALPRVAIGSHSAEPIRLKCQGPDTTTAAGALAFAQQTLDYVQRSARRPGLSRELESLRNKLSTASADAERQLLRGEILRLRRRIILSHPVLDFRQLLINKRPPPSFSHQSDQYLGRYSGPGDGLVVLDDWKTTPKPTRVLSDRLPPGSTLHPDLSYDARKVLF